MWADNGDDSTSTEECAPSSTFPSSTFPTIPEMEQPTEILKFQLQFAVPPKNDET